MSREATSFIQGLREVARMIEFLLFVSIGGLVCIAAWELWDLLCLGSREIN
jgi:hypothetical protein